MTISQFHDYINFTTALLSLSLMTPRPCRGGAGVGSVMSSISFYLPIPPFISLSFNHRPHPSPLPCMGGEPTCVPSEGGTIPAWAGNCVYEDYIAGAHGGAPLQLTVCDFYPSLWGRGWGRGFEGSGERLLKNRLYPSVMSSDASEQPFSTRHIALKIRDHVM